MTPSRKRKVLYYKRAEIAPKGATLQQYMEKAFGLANKPAMRVEDLDQEGTVKRFVNSFSPQNGMVFGQLMRYEPGKDQVVLVLDDGAQEYPVENLQVPKRADGKTSEFLESVLYFGVLENHVVILQSAALKARDLESYLSWFFTQKTKVVPPEVVLCLSDQPTKEAREKIERLPVKKVSIGAPLQVIAEQEELVEQTEKAKVNYRPYGRGFDILAAVLGPEWRKTVRLEDSLDEANLHVNLEITYFRKTTRTAHQVLDNVATSLRHLEPDDVKIHLEGGTTLKGKELKFSGQVSVNTHNGIIDSSDLYLEMWNWLKTQIEGGTIT